MKSFLAGLATILVLGIIGFFVFKGTTSLMTKLFVSPTPTPSESPLVSPTPTPSVKPTPTPAPTKTPAYVNTTKGGLVKGVSTTKRLTTTATTSHLTLTLIKSSTCPISYMTEVKDITGPLTLKYSLKDGYSFGITVWKKDGNELVSNTTYSGNSGTIKTIEGVDYMKVRIESKSCATNGENWITVTAER